jgi:membrane fusion protein, heavy metal efflux system
MRRRTIPLSATAGWALPLLLSFCGCGAGKPDSQSGAPPATKVEEQTDVSVMQVDHPERFPLVKAGEVSQAPFLTVTGVVNPDIARAVPVISLAAGRVVEIKARLGDEVKKGQVLLRVRSNDVSGAYQFYLKAVNDERLARLQYERAQTLYEKGAISKGALDQAEDAEKDAQVDLDTAAEQLKSMGLDKDHPTGIVDIVAPITGVITDQQVTNAAGAQGLSGPNPFTISDLSSVWILCDVYENDLANVHVGENADIRLVAYPDKVLTGRISNIGPILDPNIRTAKVRVEVANPGNLMRVGMFVNATFHGQKPVRMASVPASAILHLHDRDWVYVPAGEKKFRRVEVKAGASLSDKTQLIQSGVEPGQEVVSNALELQSTVEQ